MIRHAGNLALRIAALAFSLLLVLALAVAVLLARGPISLDFLTPYLRDVVNDAAAPFRVEIAGTVLTWEGWDRHLDVRIVGVRIVDPRDQATATIPQASVSLSPAALLRGKLRPSQLELIGPSVHLVRQADGRFSFDLGGGDENGSKGLDAIALSLVEGRQPAFLRSLRQLDLLDGRLVVEDRRSGAVWQVPRADIVLRRIDRGLRAELTADVAVGQRTAFLNAAALWRGVEAPSEIIVDFAGLNLAAFAAEFPLAELEPVRGLDLVTSGRLSLDFSDAHALKTLSFDISAGSGGVLLPELHPRSMDVAAAAVAGRLDMASRMLVLEEVYLDLDGDLFLRGSGVAWRAGGELGIAGQADLANLQVADLERYWPPEKGANARRWVLENILAGTVTEARLNIDIAPGDLALPTPPADMVVLDFRFQGAEAQYWEPLPHIVDGAGSARLNTDTFTLQLDSGHVGEIMLSEGRVEIDNLVGEGQVADISFLATAPAAAALELLDREPLRFASKVGIEAARVSGRSVTRARFQIPLKRDIRLDDVGYEATSDLDAFAMPEIFGLYAVSDGDLTLAVDGGGFDAKGRVALNGVPVDMAWREEFEPAAGEPESRYRLAAVLDGQDREALRLPLDPYLGGPTAVQMTVNVGSDDRVEAEGHADLREARIGVPELGIEKAAGEPGTLDFRFRTGDGRALIVERIAVRAGNLSADGSLALGPGGDLRRLTIHRLRDGANDFGAEITAAAGRGYGIRVTGRSIDLRHLLTGEGGGADHPVSPDDESPPLRLTARLERMLLTDRLGLAQAEVQALSEAGSWSYVSANGLLNGSAPVAARLESGPGAGGRVLTLTSENAGAVLRAAGIVEQAEGGRLLLTARLPADAPPPRQPIRGHLVMEGFRVVNAPVLARMLTLASLTGIHDVMTGEGIYFAALELPFTMTDAEIRIADGRAVGSQLGLTVNGVIDRRGETLDLEGTLVPAYTLNSVLGNIPLIGNLFVGRPGEGVFAISYGVHGPLAEPQVSVNPLTALAPGFLRRIVEVLADRGGAAGPKEPPSRSREPAGDR